MAVALPGQSPVNAWHLQPATHPQSGVPPRLAAIRGENFDRQIGAPYNLDDPRAAAAWEASHSSGGFAEDRYFIDNPLPAGGSDAVVIATFSGYAVALSPSRRSIYTVVHFDVERALKSTPRTLRAGGAIDYLVGGGSLNLNGTVVHFHEDSGNDTPLEERGRYLLFLKYSPVLESYFIITHWQLKAGRVIAVDLLEKRKAKEGTSRFDGHPESEIIAAAEEAIRMTAYSIR